jgi:CheY-like chemotaxis protein
MTPEDELGTPSLIASRPHFAHLTIALAYGDIKASQIAKSVLDSLGCQAVVIARDGPELFARLSRQVIDIAVIDSALQSMTGIECVRQLRHLPGSHIRDMAVVLLGDRKDPEFISQAINAGVNEYASKPFTARSLLSAIYAVIESPRPFVIAPAYIGPDRRAPSTLTRLLPAGKPPTCRRNTSPVITASVGDAAKMDRGLPILVTPDWRLKRKMGLSVNVPLAAPPDVFERTESRLEGARTAFLATIHEQMREILAYNRLLVQRPDKVTSTITAMQLAAGLVESRTRELGYSRIPEVARLLRDFCEQHFVAGDDASIVLLEKHALTLVAILNAGQSGDSGSVGESLLKDLARQVAEFRKR